MPRRAEGEPDELGARYFGPVLTGKLGVREALQRDAIRTHQAQFLELSSLPTREEVLAYFYRNGWR
jgi:hypothetical protein